MLTSTTAAIQKAMAPRRYWKSRLAALQSGSREREMRMAPLLCDRKALAVDIGADQGAFISNIIASSGHCIAFEPRLAQAQRLSEMFRALNLPVQIEAVALSDTAGTARLKVLAMDAGRSSIDPANSMEDPDGSPLDEVIVPVRRLDDYGFENVGFVKIDVEGHELAVLRGAEETLRRWTPSILIEIEERHHPNATREVPAWLGRLDYQGFFLLEGHLRPFAQFSPARHQDASHIGGWKSGWARSGTYVNNFFFVQPSHVEELQDAVAASSVARAP